MKMWERVNVKSWIRRKYTQYILCFTLLTT
jgi:hypothetical protein